MKHDRSPKEALRDLLSTRLRFGDEYQIEALFILRIAEQLLDTERTCPECDGEQYVETDGHGHCDHCGRECLHCSGEREWCTKCDGAGVVGWKRDEVYALPASRIVELLKPETGKVAA